MSGKSRFVLIPVTDPTVDTLLVEPTHRGVARGHTISFPVPVDDLLADDVDTLRRYVLQRVRIGALPDGTLFSEEVEPIPTGEEAWDAMDRLRARFQLDQEDD